MDNKNKQTNKLEKKYKMKIKLIKLSLRWLIQFLIVLNH